MRKRSRSRSRDGKKFNRDTDKDQSEEQDPFGEKAEIERRRQLRQRIMTDITKDDKQNLHEGSSESQSEDNRPTVKPVIRLSKQLPQLPFEQPKLTADAPSPNALDDDFDMFDETNYTQQREAFSNATDSEAYYRVVSGELLHNRYTVIQKCGKGVFGVVVRATTADGKQFAIKIIRNNQILAKSGEREHQLLSKLNSDYVVRCYEMFVHRGHLCLVFELLGMDLRAASKLRHTKPFDLETVKEYAIQMFIGLHALRKAKLVHADIKPDNFLLSQDGKKVKFCDFGTAFPIDEVTVIEYLVARYYRAPEIILGCHIDYAIDTWSVGCTLYELFTNDFLFPGRDHNEMLKLIMQTKGKFSIKMLKKGVFTEKHFDHNYNFLERHVDPKTFATTMKVSNITIAPERQLLHLLKTKAPVAVQHKKLVLFRDFLEQCLTLNPKHRLSPERALQHPFLNHQITLQ